MTHTNRLPLPAIIILLAVANSSAQAPTGTPPFGSFGGGPDIINLANLNSHVVAPAIHKAGRAGFNFTYDLSYDGSVWFPTLVSGTQTWQPVNNWGWRGITEVATGYVSVQVSLTFCYSYPHIPSGEREYFNNWVYHDDFGVAHPFVGSTHIFSGTCGNAATGMNALATDGSGYTVSVTSGSSANVISRAGKITHPPYQSTSGAATATNPNGNQISVDGSGNFTDTLGMTALAVSAPAPGPSSPTTFSYTPPSGGSATVTMSYVTYTVQTNFGCSGIAEYGATNNSLVDRVTLPDGSFYQFHYEATPGNPSNVTGRLASVTLPTGGMISYAYTGGSNGIVCADGSAAGLTRSTPDGTWTYARSGSAPAWTTTITDPQGNQTVILFQGIYETQRQVFQGSSAGGTLLRTWNTCYNGAAAPCAATAITLPITQRTVTDQYGSSGPMCPVSFTHLTLPTICSV